jgi:hypothetical protein
MNAMLHGIEIKPVEARTRGAGVSDLDDVAPAVGPLDVDDDVRPAQEAEPAPGPRARRGRPKKADSDLEGVKQMLLVSHMMLATVSKCQELQIDEQEATMFATSLARLAEHYKIKISGKSGALISFIYTLGIIYGPRAVAISVRIRRERETNRGTANAN